MLLFIYKNKNCIGGLYGNVLYELNIRDFVNNILTENDSKYIMSIGGNNNILKDYILQNIESDKNIKKLILSFNNKSTKNILLIIFWIGKWMTKKKMNFGWAICH